MRKIEWVIIKSCFIKRKLIHREIYGHSNKIKECNKMIRDYKQIILNGQEPFLKDSTYVRGIGNRYGVDVRDNNNKLVELRIHSVNIHFI